MLGVALAFAIAERIIQSEAYTLFVTHYPQLTLLPELYSNAKNIHLKTSIEESDETNIISHSMIKYHRTISFGPWELNCAYGITMAEILGFPLQFIKTAKTIRTIVSENWPILLGKNKKENNLLILLNQILQNLVILKNTSLATGPLIKYLMNLKANIPDDVAKSMSAWINTKLSLVTSYSSKETTIHIIEDQSESRDILLP